MLHELFSVYLKMLVLYSPFFVLSCFISLTRGYSSKERKHLAWKVAIGVLVSSVLLYLFGRVIFGIFGITADAFRVVRAACCSFPHWAWHRASLRCRPTACSRTSPSCH